MRSSAAWKEISSEPISREIYSKLVFENSCTGEQLFTMIEPLAGMLRDPRPICGPSVGLQPHRDNVQTKELIVLDPAAIGEHAKRIREGHGRAILFDLGATTWADTGFRWLVDSYEKLGVKFEHIYAWEVKPMTGTMFFDGMPVSVA